MRVYTLYIKTHGFHWNVTGLFFAQYHSMFEDQYDELSDAVDEIAERIRALGHTAPGSFAQFAEAKSIDEASGAPNAQEMVAELLADHETIARRAREVAVQASGAGEEASADLMIQRIQAHEKAAWMLRSTLAE
jgi:starvation-inducible DNA-binding protein